MSIKLSANGFGFEIEPLPPLNGWFNGYVSLHSELLDNFNLKSNFYAPFEDWQSLCDYIEKHIEKHLNGDESDSPTWVCYDASLIFTCLMGEIEKQNGTLDGGFSIQSMIKIGSDYEAENPKYANVGFESWVDVNEALAFCKALREYVASQKQITAVA